MAINLNQAAGFSSYRNFPEDIQIFFDRPSKARSLAKGFQLVAFSAMFKKP